MLYGIANSRPPEEGASSKVRWGMLIDTTNELPMMCQHCANPPCVDVCPTGASMKRADGIVLVDRHTCIGCRYCMMACPYKARSFVHAPLHRAESGSPARPGLCRILHLLRASRRQGSATRLRRACPRAP
jgi:tetrathionate reductase subunit B